MTRCEEIDKCAFDVACDNYAMNCSAIEADERGIVERHRPAIEARVRAEVAEEIADAIEMNVRNPDFDKQDRGGWPDFPSKMAYVAGHDNAAKIARLAAGSSPDTTKEIDGTDRPADEAIVPPPASAGFNPAYRVARCGQGSAHSPHVMEHGPDQPRNCPGGEAL